ncbi:hypothetical protein BKA62DRAFT_774674 [Auriculariales sp. MPI-PUGE-AT-0066]|nr:hypothetical protein BKA62DRAFT_774674 [Auriculariales sp. MPI-PUGE-AT-0066]
MLHGSLWDPQTPATATGNKVAVTGYIREWAKHSDLQVDVVILPQYRPDLADPITFSEELRSTSSGDGIATNVPTTYVSFCNGTAGDWDTFLADLLESALYFADLPDEQLPQGRLNYYGSDESRLSPALAEYAH